MVTYTYFLTCVVTYIIVIILAYIITIIYATTHHILKQIEMQLFGFSELPVAIQWETITLKFNINTEKISTV